MEQLQQELKNIKQNILFLLIGLFWFWWILFWINYYLNKYYVDLYKQKKQEIKNINRKIDKYKNKINSLLQWQELNKIKNMENLFDIYFKNRFLTLPKVLVLEFLEEILPPNVKIWNTLSIGKDFSINLNLYAKDTKQLNDLYAKLQYYQKLWLFDVKWFNTIELKKWNKKYNLILGQNVKYLYKTNISLSLNYKNLLKYYSVLFNNEKISKILNQNNIDPLKIPNNITVNDIIKLHKLYNKLFKHEKITE